MENGQLTGHQRAKAVAVAAAVMIGLVAYAKAQTSAKRPEVGVASIVPSSTVAVAPAAAASPEPPFLMPTPAQAPAAPVTPAALVAKPAPAEVLEISSADRIAIRVQGQRELSADYRVNEDQTISIPVLGRVAIAHLDAAGLEKRLSQRLAELTGRQAFVTVEVIEYRPVFVSGFVNKPGTSPWKPGMTVLQAVTVAGGTFRGPDSTGIAGPGTKVQRAVDDQKRVLATIARLTAEQKVAETIEMPPRLVALVGRPEAEELIAGQMTSFLSRKNAIASQADGLRRAIALAKEELLTIKAQRERMNAQLTFRRAQYVELKALYTKQFLRMDRLTEEQIKIADLEEKVASLGVSLSRTDSTLIGFERDLANFQQDRRALIDTDLLRLERDAAQLELELEAAGPLPRKISKPLSDRDADGAKKEQLLFEIVRQEGAVPKTHTAERNTPVKPGDMVVVSVQ